MCGTTRKRYETGMSQEEAVQDIALNDYATWAGWERIVVNNGVESFLPRNFFSGQHKASLSA